MALQCEKWKTFNLNLYICNILVLHKGNDVSKTKDHTMGIKTLTIKHYKRIVQMNASVMSLINCLATSKYSNKYILLNINQSVVLTFMDLNEAVHKTQAKNALDLLASLRGILSQNVPYKKGHF